MDVLAARVLLEPRDLDVSLAFYEEGLGLHRFREWGERPHRGVVLFLGGAYLELKETSSAATAAPPAGVRLWVQVPDLDSCMQELASRGISPVEPPERKGWGLLEATIADPDGLHLVLVEVPVDHPLRRDTR
jgi:catechol 2,3-dioxygenase-like lactoylglutathione lyase family enzyme